MSTVGTCPECDTPLVEVTTRTDNIRLFACPHCNADNVAMNNQRTIQGVWDRVDAALPWDDSKNPFSQIFARHQLFQEEFAKVKVTVIGAGWRDEA